MRAVVALLVLGAAVRADDDPVPALLVRLESGKPAERAVATRTLGRLDDARAVAAVLRAQEDGAGDVRHEAAIALANAGKADAATVAILARSVEDRDWYVRWQACVALKRIGPKAEPAVPALAAALGDGTVDVSREAALALATIAPKDERTIAALVAAIEGGMGDRAAIFHATGMCGKAAEPAVPALGAELRKPGASAREQAFAALRAIAPGTVDVYAGLLDADDPAARVFGVRGLAGTRSERTCAQLARALGDKDPAVRAAAAGAAKEMGKFAWKALPALVPLLADESDHLRKAGAEAIAAAGAPQLADIVHRATWNQKRTLFGIWSRHSQVDLTTLQFPYSDDAKCRALKDVLVDPDVGAGILAAVSGIKFDRDVQGLLESVIASGPPLDASRCAILLLPHVAKDRKSAASALRAARENPDLKDLAEAGLRMLEE